MINPNKIEEMARSIQAALPPGLKSVGEEVDKEVKQVLQAQLMKLDPVSREEFDVQTKVLLRTREKLQALEENRSSWKNSWQSVIKLLFCDKRVSALKPVFAD